MRNITAKIREGERISDEECLELFKYPDIIDLGHLADIINQSHNAKKVWFNEHRYLRINPSSKQSLDNHNDKDRKRFVQSFVEKSLPLITNYTSEVRFGTLHPKLVSVHLKNVKMSLH